jgi:hypothetical protein
MRTRYRKRADTFLSLTEVMALNVGMHPVPIVAPAAAGRG